MAGLRERGKSPGRVVQVPRGKVPRRRIPGPHALCCCLQRSSWRFIKRRLRPVFQKKKKYLYFFFYFFLLLRHEACMVLKITVMELGFVDDCDAFLLDAPHFPSKVGGKPVRIVTNTHTHTHIHIHTHTHIHSYTGCLIAVIWILNVK